MITPLARAACRTGSIFFARAAQRLERQIATMEGRGSRGNMLGGLLGGLGVGMVGKSALSMAAEREQQKISFGVMTGSQANGVDYYLAIPFAPPPVTPMQRSLISPRPLPHGRK